MTWMTDFNVALGGLKIKHFSRRIANFALNISVEISDLGTKSNR